MKLIEALKIAGATPQGAEPMRVALVCGFTPLHLKTFLQAELQLRHRSRAVEITTGVYGDIPGTLQNLDASTHAGALVIIEWADIDARLGIRQLGGWSPSALPSIVERSAVWLAHVRALIERVAGSVPVAVALPTLPLPPLFFTAGWQSSRFETELRAIVAAFGKQVAEHLRVRLVNSQRLDALAAPATRLNVKSEWTTGFPYENAHASALASVAAQLLEDRVPKKGLITDLDDTLWRGILGDIGVKSIGWDLDHHAQAHGFYQQMLQTLAEEGVLVAVASKNDPVIVEQAFARPDLLLGRDNIFPFEVSWGTKAVAVSRILKRWNVAADAVVFVDDNPMELAEVAAAHPGIECMQFPEDRYQVYAMCEHLRDLFGRSSISEEDRLRLSSLLSAEAVQEKAGEGEGFSEALLEGAQAELTLSFHKDPNDRRALDLINKTNQFNLNGRRYADAEWTRLLATPDGFALTATYRDRFGALGKIGVMAGRVNGRCVEVDSWVLSCRAFARRIEHQCLNALFAHFDVPEVTLNYEATARNAPTAQFLEAITGAVSSGRISIARNDFEKKCPKLFHKVYMTDEMQRLASMHE